MNQRIHEPTNQPGNQWASESVNQRIHQSMKQWTNESANQGNNERMNQQVIESLTKRMKAWMKGKDGWTDGIRWMSYVHLLSYFFTERPHRWGTSSLSYFFSEQPPVWLTSAPRCPPASSSVAAATQFFSLRSCYNAATATCSHSYHPASQEGRITHALLRAAVPMMFTWWWHEDKTASGHSSVTQIFIFP